MTQQAQLTAAFQAVGADIKALQEASGAGTAVTASEALAAGDFVNVWDSGGVAAARKADASASGKRAHGFVLDDALAGSAATVYFRGVNTACTGLTPGTQFLSTAPGGCTAIAPTAAGNVLQCIGLAVSSTAVIFDPQMPITLA